MSDDSNQNFQLNLIQMAQTVRDKIIKSQEEAYKKTCTATVGGGMVTVTANGQFRVLSIKIDPEVIDPNDPDMLGDLILAAVNEALSQVQSLIKKETREISAGLDLSALF
ncbi:MAG: YbaB/EbfC family nucleoid-associated protein [Deltaproteobacteria bacterium]|jgi:DNA-binding YbaB/EbfC family protein|nr:YbaB/EbfC family nucleoid-associated protein [Deltaproteobacteria bacterium]